MDYWHLRCSWSALYDGLDCGIFGRTDGSLVVVSVLGYDARHVFYIFSFFFSSFLAVILLCFTCFSRFRQPFLRLDTSPIVTPLSMSEQCYILYMSMITFVRRFDGLFVLLIGSV